jgi:general secretion pathway protein H
MANPAEQELMLRLVIGMNANKGFTLIELLVVIVIIGITIGFALISFGDFGEGKKIIYAAEQLERTLRLAQQQAILDSSTLGLHIDNKSYQILKFHISNQWRPVSANNLFRTHYFPNDMIITLKTDFKVNLKEPGIIINSSGETNAFILNFGTTKEKRIAVLSGRGNGELNFTTARK